MSGLYLPTAPIADVLAELQKRADNQSRSVREYREERDHLQRELDEARESLRVSRASDTAARLRLMDVEKELKEEVANAADLRKMLDQERAMLREQRTLNETQRERIQREVGRIEELTLERDGLRESCRGYIAELEKLRGTRPGPDVPFEIKLEVDNETTWEQLNATFEALAGRVKLLKPKPPGSAPYDAPQKLSVGSVWWRRDERQFVRIKNVSQGIVSYNDVSLTANPRRVERASMFETSTNMNRFVEVATRLIEEAEIDKP